MVRGEICGTGCRRHSARPFGVVGNTRVLEAVELDDIARLLAQAQAIALHHEAKVLWSLIRLLQNGNN